MTHPAPRFCSNCGKPLYEEARFCGSCGAQVIASPAQPAMVTPTVPQSAHAALHSAPVNPLPVPAVTPPQALAGPETQPEEPIIQAIASLIRRKGLFGREPFLLLLTPRRLVFAAITAEQQKWAADQAKENARQQGKGFLKQWGAVITSLNFLVDTYRAMPVPLILAHHPDNYYIDLDQIQQIKTRVNWDAESNSQDEVEIRFSGDKQKFELAGCSARDVKNALKPLLGNRVK
jgi:hypothetical protein